MTTMRRTSLAPILLAAILGSPASVHPVRAEITTADVLERYAAARGGVERWREAKSITLEGTYAAFSDYEPFTLVRAPQRLYRLDFTILGSPAIRAHDVDGPWWQHPLLQPEASRLEEGPYKALVERESRFAPLLIDPEASGVEVEMVGPDDIDGIPVLAVRVGLPGGAEEIWYLDPESWLEVAVDSQVHDFTQSTEPMRQRAFFDDFRQVDGLVLPFRVEYEYGHRLESMTVETARVDAKIDPTTFAPPEPDGEAE